MTRRCPVCHAAHHGEPFMQAHRAPRVTPRQLAVGLLAGLVVLVVVVIALSPISYYAVPR